MCLFYGCVKAQGNATALIVEAHPARASAFQCVQSSAGRRRARDCEGPERRHAAGVIPRRFWPDAPLRRPQSPGLRGSSRALQRVPLVRLRRALRVAGGVRGRRGDLAERPRGAATGGGPRGRGTGGPRGTGTRPARPGGAPPPPAGTSGGGGRAGAAGASSHAGRAALLPRAATGACPSPRAAGTGRRRGARPGRRRHRPAGGPRGRGGAAGRRRVAVGSASSPGRRRRRRRPRRLQEPLHARPRRRLPLRGGEAPAAIQQETDHRPGRPGSPWPRSAARPTGFARLARGEALEAHPGHLLLSLRRRRGPDTCGNQILGTPRHPATLSRSRRHVAWRFTSPRNIPTGRDVISREGRVARHLSLEGHRRHGAVLRT